MVYKMPRYTSLSQVPGTSQYYRKESFITGHDQGYIHVPGQVGSYSAWMQPGAQEAHARNVGQMQAAKEQWRALSMPGMYAAEKAYQAGLPTGAYLAPGTGSAAYGTPIRVGGPLTVAGIAPTAARSYGGAATGLAAGGSALARGGPSVGVPPGAGLGTAAAAGGGGLTAAEGLGLGGIGGSITNAGTGVINTAKEYMPLAIKVVLAVIAIKIILWLVRKR